MTKERRKSERTSTGDGGKKYRRHGLPEGVERVRGKYRARWPRLPGEPGSGRYRKGQVTPHLRQAAKEAEEGRERYEKAMAGHKIQRGEWTLAKAMEAVLDECRVKNNSPGTVRFYNCHFQVLKRAWPEGAAALRTITTAQVELFRTERQREKIPGKSGRFVSAQTICHDLQALSRCFEVATRKGHPGENPVRMVTRPRVKAVEPDWFTRQEILGILDRIRATPLPRVDSEGDADLLLFAFATGLRLSELARLTVGSVRFSRGTISVEGKKRRRVLPIPAAMVPLLQRIIAWPERSYLHSVRQTRIAGQGPSFKWKWEGEDEGRFLLPGEHEERRAIWAQTTFQRWQKNLKEPRLHPRAMRHSFTDHLYACGYSMEFVNSLTGHAKDSRNAAHRYHHVRPLDRMRGMEMLWQEPPESQAGVA